MYLFFYLFSKLLVHWMCVIQNFTNTGLSMIYKTSIRFIQYDYEKCCIETI